jgi:hypothetical protein
MPSAENARASRGSQGTSARTVDANAKPSARRA